MNELSTFIVRELAILLPFLTHLLALGLGQPRKVPIAFPCDLALLGGEVSPGPHASLNTLLLFLPHF